MTDAARPDTGSGRGTEKDRLDARGLIAEAYAIEGIHEADCRSIFFDWALGLAPEIAPRDAIAALLERHRDRAADHPMTVVLRQGLSEADAPRGRRGGRRGRVDGSR